jgi:predicted TIM-barrel fold metal-dependent hydrolase
VSAAFVPSDAVARIRTRLDHPVIDADGHQIEFMPLVRDHVVELAGEDAARHLDELVASGTRVLQHPPGDERRRRGLFRTGWWSVPTRNTLDRATCTIPSLLHQRLDEIGLDFTILYSSVGLVCFAHPDDEIRRASCRGLNTYLAEICDGFGGRLTPAAVIPSHTPEEAIAELEYAVQQLGLKAAVLNSYVARAEPDGRVWTDVLALDSPHNYDPLWQRFVDLGVAVTAHSPSMGLQLRQSSSRYMFNHIGNFAASSDAFAKGLVFGGVPHRFPTLNVGFLECGVAWGVQLLFDLVGRWEKRGGRHIEQLDPARIDLDEWRALVDQYGGAQFGDELDFRATGVQEARDLVGMFDRFFFGCEADEGTVGWAFAVDVNPFGAVLQPVLGSDIGHWDVPDMRDVVPEAYELVADGRLDADGFRAFTCDNPIRLHAQMNPQFFAGTPVDTYATQLLTH